MLANISSHSFFCSSKQCFFRTNQNMFVGHDGSASIFSYYSIGF